MSAQWNAYPDAQAAAAACASHIASVLQPAIAAGGTATVAFSGGSTPKLMFAELAKAGLDWSRVHVFFVDERTVPPDHPDSNYGMAKKHLIEPAGIPQANVHRMQGELPPAEAARQYEHEIAQVFGIAAGDLPKFDVVHLGMGGDAHTASLFPGEPLIQDRSGTVAAVHVEKLNSSRITLLPGVLLGARHILVLAAGEDKAEAARQVFYDPYNAMHFPAQLVAHDAPGALWFLDTAAARLLAA